MSHSRRGLRAILSIVICIVLGLAGGSRAETPLDARFQAARDLRAAGLFKEAIPKLRAILRADPDANDVREELGYALLLNKQFAAAQYHFQILAERSPDQQKRALYRAVLRRLQAERPFGVNLIFSLVPTTNVTNGSNHDSLNALNGVWSIDEGSRAKSGWRRSIGMSGYAQHPIGTRDLVKFNWRWLHTSYDTALREDTREVEGSLTWQRLTRRGAVFASFGRMESSSDSETLTRDRFRFGGSVRRGAQGQFNWSVQRDENSYETNTAKSGEDHQLTLRYTWKLPRTQNIWAGILLEHSEPGLAHQRYRGQVLQLGGLKVFRNGVILNGSLSIGRRDFTGVFPAVSPQRERFDRFHELSLSIQDSRISWQGFTPLATCRARWNSSNIELFDNTSHECGLELTRRF